MAEVLKSKMKGWIRVIFRVSFVDLRTEEHGWNEKLYECDENMELNTFVKYLSSLEFISMDKLRIFLRSTDSRDDDRLIYTNVRGG